MSDTPETRTFECRIVRSQVGVTREQMNKVNAVKDRHRTSQWAVIDSLINLLDQLTTEQHAKLIRGELRITETQ